MSKGNKKARNNLIPVREPNGRLSRSTEHAIDPRSPGEIRRLRDAAAKRMADPEWGTELGRLFLEGKLSQQLYKAGKLWGGLVEAYHRATGAPPSAPSSSAFFNPGKRQPPDPDSDEGRRQAERDMNIVSEMHEAHAILIIAGKMPERVVRAVCERDETIASDFEVKALDVGLSWLAQHWGLISKPGNVRTPL